MEAENPSSRTVIFVGGVRFSGTTMLDQMLGNDDEGHSCGELLGYFMQRPRPMCLCGDPDCAVWATIRQRPRHFAYKQIIKASPATRFIIDSSKSPLWIAGMAKAAQEQGFTVRHLLIWKSPPTSAMSYAKRNILNRWNTEWLDYHRLYFSLVPIFATVQYEELVDNVDTLASICRFTGMTYFAGKERFWEKKHHTIGGNASTSIHSMDATDPRYEKTQQLLERQNAEVIDRRTIRRADSSQDFRAKITEITKEDKRFDLIDRILRRHDVGRMSTLSNAQTPTYPRPYVWLRQLVFATRMWATSFR